MDFIKNWAFSICLTLIISLIFSLISPKGNMGRFYKVIIAVFIFASFIFPIAEFDASELKADFDIESEFYDVSAEAAKNQVKLIIENELKNNGIEPLSIECDVSSLGNEISIDRVVITISLTYDSDNVKNIVFDNLGIAAEVQYADE